MSKLFLLSSLLLFSISNVKANIINVPNDQPSIQAGIDSALTSDTVLVQPGIYYENIDFKGKNVTVGSLYLINSDTSLISQTIIDGNNHGGSVVLFSRGEDSSAILIGFTLQRGSGIYHVTGFWSEGGGIYCTHSSPTLRNLIIKDNSYASDGGGIYIESSNIRLYDTVIKNNFVSGSFGGVGGGILIAWCTGIIRNVQFINNSATRFGGAIYSYNSNIKLENILFDNNFSNNIGAAISGKKSIFRLTKVTSINNSAITYGGSIECGDSTQIEIINSIFWNEFPDVVYFSGGNTPNKVTVLNSDIHGGPASIQSNNNGVIYWLDGNINLYPQFVDTSLSNYNLRPNSPCIDTGIQDTIIVYNNNIDTIIISQLNYKGLAPDMGAFEFDPATQIYNKPSPLENYILFQNYPNPFNPTTTIKYTIPKSQRVKIEVFNLLGQKIVTLLNKQVPAGTHKVVFIADDLPSGLYLYKIAMGEYQETKKMILLR